MTACYRQARVINSALAGPAANLPRTPDMERSR